MSTMGKLRDIKADELTLMLSWRNAPAARANMYTTHEISVEEHLAWWSKVQQSADKQYFLYETDGAPYGVVGFVDIDNANCRSSWAFYAAPEAPRGTGSKMEFLALEHAFYDLNVHKLHCEVLAFNEPVINLHKKFGFKIEGILREHYKRGTEYIDVYKLGLLFNEWEEAREEMREKLTKLMRK